MTNYELTYQVLKLFEHPLYYQVNRIIKKNLSSNTQLLDVGGRTSPQTIGLRCDVYISELPRESEVQKDNKLGMNDGLESVIKKRRSNIKAVLYDDMVKSNLEDGRFDVVTAVEVLEHVREDEKFVENVYKKLRDDGVFIMTTPNGDFITEMTSPDHVRHYRKVELEQLLNSRFDSVEVFYSVLARPYFRMASNLHSRFENNRPLRVISPGIFHFLTRLQSSRKSVGNRPIGTCHLVAVCKKDNKSGARPYKWSSGKDNSGLDGIHEPMPESISRP